MRAGRPDAKAPAGTARLKSPETGAVTSAARRHPPAGLKAQLFGVENQMNLLDLARKSGMTVVLDAKIGRQEYHTVYSSVGALERFAELVAASLQDQTLAQD